MNEEDIQPDNEHVEERRLAELIASLEADAAPIDDRRLAELRGHSTAAFAHAMRDHTAATVGRTEKRRDPRSRLYAWSIAAAAAIAAVVTASLWSGAAADDGQSFGFVLNQVAMSDSIEINLTRDGRTERLWVKRPQRLRWDRADGTYQIARGQQLWDVNEQANQAKQGAAPYFPGATGPASDAQGFNVLALLDLPAEIESRDIESAQPAEQVERSGETLDVYRWDVPAAAGGVPLRIEAFVHADTQMLASIAADEIGPLDRRRPRAAINVVAYNRPIDDSLFIVGDALTDDGRIGKMADVQGIVTLKPVMHQRWTPVATHLLLRPGDWLRTDVRGANAVALRLVKDTLVTLGPGSLLEVQSPNRLRLSSGELKIVAEQDAPIELLGPGDEKIEVVGAAIYRLQNDRFVRLEKPPLWLAGFEGTTNNESLGSLVAKVDGRDVPLTVGYHKVTVDIRDQIARTVIEESFVNRTNGRLEGVFYFPLPQDASISGFGMWIGSELVEADVVEKQRAREIYETILREKRDPGLLEWTGGNIFKARVFPIEPHSEKRIKISYTQVLPLLGKTYRYSYGLRSELLKQNPLRELAIDVRLNSVQALASIKSPTHTTARVDRTPHSAHVEFTAQEYVPERDFEVVVELADNQPNIVLVPHRRGEDGYFMLMLAPPDGAGQWQREVLPDGKPLHLLILADTSASMDAASRQVQADFIASLLASLGPADKFNLSTCDVTCDWAFPAAVSADESHVAAARTMLADRVSLGWTDLDKAFASALEQAGADSHIIYVGDGIVTTKDADPAAFAKRLAQLCQESRVPLAPPVPPSEDVNSNTSGADAAQSTGRASGTPKGVALHAVSVSSSFEPMVMKAIASEGGGSVRQVSGERTPQAVALDLLAEISRPTLRNLKVEFNGIRTARVYPSELPNLAAGSQQIVLGRYLPTIPPPRSGEGQQGEVIVTAMQGDEPVRFRTAVSLRDVPDGADAADDVSFIPRLWARMHLDALLAQGASQAIQDEIIALSEEYHIITPYTSLLVLESDADRERFGVKRRFQIRDAERFFATGRDNANYELMVQQMQRAGTWRLGLRQQVLAQLIGLGRDANAFNPQWPQQLVSAQGVGAAAEASLSFPTSGRGGAFGGGGFDRSAGWYVTSGGSGQVAPFHGNLSLVLPGSAERDFDELINLIQSTVGAETWNGNRVSFGGNLSLVISQTQSVWDEFDGDTPWNEPVGTSNIFFQLNGRMEDLPSFAFFNGAEASERFGVATYSIADNVMPIGEFGGFRAERYAVDVDKSNRSSRYLRPAGRRYSYDDGYQYTSWLDTLFPAVPPVPPEEQPFEPEKPWPEEVRTLVAGLLRTEQLAALVGGLRIERHSESFDPRWDELTARSDTLELVSAAAWLVRSGGFGSQTLVQWCDQDERGTYGEAFQLGRRRESSPRDLARPPLGLAGHLLHSLERSYANYDARLEPQADNQTRLVLTRESNPGYEVRILIDTARKVILSIEYRQDGEVTSTVKYDQFVQIAGAWYAGRRQHFDKQGRRTAVTTEKYTLLDAGVFANELAPRLAGRDRVQFMKAPLPTVVDAKQALEAGKTSFDDRLLLLLLDCANQQWDSALENLAAAEQLAGDKPGLRWVRDAILNISRRREELRGRILAVAGGLAGPGAGTPRLAGVAESESLFLANYLFGQASGIFEANELLALLDVLKPVYERQPAHLAAMNGWTQNRMNYLRNVGRPNEALALQKQLAEKWPHDVSLQMQYARVLANEGEWDAAYAWLDRVTTADAKWHAHEEESLRSTYADLLNQQGRWPEMANFLARWVALTPDSANAYERYLAALLRLDRIDEMNALIAKWLEEGRGAGRLPGDVSSRLQAAVNRALGDGHDIRTNRLDERWLDSLAETVRFFARHATTPQFADQIMNDRNFRRSDPCRQLRREFLAILQEELATLKQAELDRLLNWVWPNDPAIEADVWRALATRLETRWAATADPDEKHQLGTTIVRVVSGRLTAADYLAFLRRQLNEGPEKYRTQYASQLFNALVAQPWTADLEDEAFGLLTRLSGAETPAQKLLDEIRALHQLTDRMLAARYAALMALVEHQEELTRTELRDKQQENTRLAREGFADRLEQARGEFGDALGKWLLMERLYVDVLLGRNLDRVADECWELLGPPPAAAAAREDDAPADADALVSAYLDAVLRHRAFVTLANLAVRKEAKPELVARLLDYVDQALAAAAPEDVRWKSFKYQLLVALDRPKDLEENLRAWLRMDDPLSRWRIALAYLLAEQGKLTDAVPLFEQVEAKKELGPSEYRALADWYLALDRREKHEATLEAVLSFTQEYQLSNWLWQQLQPWQINNSATPSELDANVFRTFSVLFKKSGSPQNYAHQLREFYRATRDFRLLAGLADSVVGHTAGRVYPFLQSLDQVFSEVREEATVDSLEAEIEKVRTRVTTVIDLRALDLLEAIIQRRAAELLNQPGPHAEKALVALRRAFEREWSPGEERLMANLLAGMGKIAQPDLAAEQVRELEALHARFAAGSLDRLHVAHALAQCHWNYSRQSAAIDLLEAALAEYRTAHDGILSAEANGPLDSFVSYLEQTTHHARGEQVLFEELTHPVNLQQTFWLRQRLYQLYNNSIASDGAVSLGSGVEMYRAAQRQLQSELDTPDQNHRQNLVNLLCNMYRTADRKHFVGVGQDLRGFAFERLPAVLRMQTNNYQTIVHNVAQTLHDVNSPRDGLELLVACIEREPSWFRFNNQDGWQRFSGHMAEWRKEADDVNQLDAALKERLLAIVLRELRADLESMQSRNRDLYHFAHRNTEYFWAEKKADFRRTAEAVYAERSSSGAAVKYIADYVYHGLRDFDRAIEMLLIAYRDRRLDEDGSSTLVRYLHNQNRYGESIAILESLIERSPENLGHRTALMDAYRRTDRPAQLLALLRQTDEYLHAEGRWIESSIAALAEACWANQLYEPAVAYYEEAISLRQRSLANRGVGDGTLAEYYRHLALSYSGMKNTSKGVEAAAAAIVAWGPTHENRRLAVDALRQVLEESPDLDAYVAELDRQVEESGLENPIVRLALGKAYSGKGQYAKAAAQLKLARDVQPNDAETHKLLVECYDRLNDRQGAIEQLLSSLELSRRDIELYKDLGRRYAQLEQPAQAERARTAIVEMLPNESESHTALAEIRQEQGRWDEAIEHWRRVCDIRKLEPTGLLKLAEAQIHQRAWSAAEETLRRLESNNWPTRFGDVRGRVRELRQRID